MKELRCAEIGFFPTCPAVMRGPDEEAVLAEAGRHAREAHGLGDADMTPESLEKVRAAIREV